jgi:hypothetical protein
MGVAGAALTVVSGALGASCGAAAAAVVEAATAPLDEAAARQGSERGEGEDEELRAMLEHAVQACR